MSYNAKVQNAFDIKDHLYDEQRQTEPPIHRVSEKKNIHSYYWL